MPDTRSPSRVLAMDAVRVTESAALATSRYMGRGDEEMAVRAAVDAMHETLATLAIDGTVRIGEGTAEEVDKLYIGEKVGGGGPRVDVALLALEGQTMVAKGEPNALSVMAMADEGGFLNTPEAYMEKIAIGAGLPAGLVDLDAPPAENLRELAKAKKVDIGDLVVCALDRPRHSELIARIREAGARIMLIYDGDVSGVIAAARPGSGVDMFMGTGGAPQGVLAAAALRCVGGQMQARLILKSRDERERARQFGITDYDRKYSVDDMARGQVTFAATGVTSGALLSGVVRNKDGAITHSMVLRSKTGTVRVIEATHNFQVKPSSGRPGA